MDQDDRVTDLERRAATLKVGDKIKIRLPEQPATIAARGLKSYKKHHRRHEGAGGEEP
jgi:hypothetical protein